MPEPPVPWPAGAGAAVPELVAPATGAPEPAARGPPEACQGPVFGIRMKVIPMVGGCRPADRGYPMGDASLCADWVSLVIERPTCTPGTALVSLPEQERELCASRSPGPLGPIPARLSSDSARCRLAPTASGLRRNLAAMHAQARDPGAGWEPLRARVARLAPRLSAPPAVPRPGAPPLCASCRGPAWPGCSRCYQCHLQAECLAGLLPDVVVPIAYAVKGSEHATNLWLYKSAGPGSAAAAAALRALLVVFLRDHGPCAWRAAGMTTPTHLALIPSGRGRPGPHPLRSLAAPYLALPWAGLSLRSRDDQQIRDLDPERFGAQRLPGARVVLLDDTWTSGASAASASAAFKLAGARSVAVIALGRHVAAAPAQPGPGVFSPAVLPFRPWLCAVHGAAT